MWKFHSNVTKSAWASGWGISSVSKHSYIHASHPARSCLVEFTVAEYFFYALCFLFPLYSSLKQTSTSESHHERRHSSFLVTYATLFDTPGSTYWALILLLENKDILNLNLLLIPSTWCRHSTCTALPASAWACPIHRFIKSRPLWRRGSAGLPVYRTLYCTSLRHVERRKGVLMILMMYV